jgi:Asp-tRNA(Asn)/Glu-tRNA(Gln) amidotransferase A subunit family amidase
MKNLIRTAILFLITIQALNAQQKADNKKEINTIIATYLKSVKEKDSITFYALFNNENVTWCAAEKDRTHAKEIELKGLAKAGSNYWSATYKDFLRSLFEYKLIKDKFDNILIIEDGTVASVTMDYSLWIDNKIHNWGCKYLMLIKKDGIWKITSVLYSYELAEYFEQPTLKERQKH